VINRRWQSRQLTALGSGNYHYRLKALRHMRECSAVNIKLVVRLIKRHVTCTRYSTIEETPSF